MAQYRVLSLDDGGIRGFVTAILLQRIVTTPGLEPLFNTFGAATHVLGYCDQTLVSHAMWVTRWLQTGTLPVMRTAYIEMVATDQAYRGRGFASAVMRRVAHEIQDFDLGALCPSSVAYYERLGWERWRGPLFIRTDRRPRADTGR